MVFPLFISSIFVSYSLALISHPGNDLSFNFKRNSLVSTSGN